MDRKFSSAVRFYRHETGDYLIRDLCTLGGDFTGCEYGVADGTWGTVAWKPCREGVEFSEIEPVMPNQAGASGATRGSGASAGVTMPAAYQGYEVMALHNGMARPERHACEGMGVDGGYLTFSMRRHASPVIAVYAPGAWQSVREVQTYWGPNGESEPETVVAADDLSASAVNAAA